MRTRILYFAALLVFLTGGIGQAADDNTKPSTEELLGLINTLQQQISKMGGELKALKEQLSETVSVVEAAPPEEEPVTAVAPTRTNQFGFYWKDGIRLDTDDGAFKLKISGRIQNDWAWFDDSSGLRAAFGDNEDGTEFRRTRLSVGGTIYNDFEFKSQYDFADGMGEFKDMFIAAKNIPVIGRVSVGQFKEPFGLDENTSSKYITFMERNQASETFSPGRNTGIMANNQVLNDRMTWAIGVFRSTDDFGAGSDDGGYNVTGRLTGLPWYQNEGEKLLHMAVAYSRRNVDDELEFDSRPNSHLAETYLATDVFDVDEMDLFGAELALQCGSFSLQSEFFMADVDTVMLGSRSFGGYYVQTGYFLTGEHRPYETEEAIWGRLKPNKPFSIRNRTGAGAWEIALRFGEVDLNDGAIRGGEEENTTLALNWYLNPNLRVMFNYIHAKIDHDMYDGTLDTFQTRFQVDF